MSDVLHSDLTTAALADLADTFRRRNHLPSDRQWAALTDLLAHYAAAANGVLQPAIYLSCIPPGTGKSTAVQAFARALVANPAYAGVGILIAVNRVEEVEDMAEALVSARSKLCCIVAERRTDVLAMGDHGTANEAQITVTTQASLRRSLQGREFSKAARYWFRGAPRGVVQWDEGLAFNRPVILSADAIGSLRPDVRRQAGAAGVQALSEWQVVLDRAEAGSHDVPSFDGIIDFIRLEEQVGDREDMVATVKALAVVSGSRVHLAHDNLSGAAVLTHVKELPDSLLPIIVTDASGSEGVGATRYDQMVRPSRPVQRLADAEKTYGNMTIRIVDRAASRSAYRDRNSDKAREHIELAVAYVQRCAPEPVLIISYGSWMPMKGLAERTIQEAITARLNESERERTKHLTYGRHTSTNDFQHIGNVLLMGLNFTPRLAHHAASGAALDKSMQTSNPIDHPTDDQIADMGRAMLRESTFQATLRGRARMAVGSDCGRQETIVIQAMQSGLSVVEYQALFPGAMVVIDETLAPVKPLRGQVKQLADIVDGLLADGRPEVVDDDLIGALGITSKNFTRLVKRPDWREWVQVRGLRPCRLKGKLNGLRKVA